MLTLPASSKELQPPINSIQPHSCAPSRNRTCTPLRGWDFLTTIAFATKQYCLWSGLYLNHIFRLRFSVSSLYTFFISKAWLGITILKASPNLRSSTQRLSSWHSIFQVLRVYQFHHPAENY